MAEISNLGYMVLGASDLGAWKRFAVDVIGMAVGSEDSASALALRADDYAQRIRLEQNTSEDIIAAGWELDTERELLEFVAEVHEKGIEISEGDAALARSRRVTRLFFCSDPSGYRHEFYCGPELAAVQDAINSTVLKGGFKTGRLGIGHIVTASKDYSEATRFYMDGLGLRLSDVIEADLQGFKLEVLFMHAATGRHHSLATAAVDFGGKALNHIMLEVNDMNDVGLAYERCLRAQYPITRHLGHHPNDDMFSFYVRTPSGFDLEFGYGGRVVDDSTWSIRRYREMSDWGHSHTPPGVPA